jgi:hypothetical protein
LLWLKPAYSQNLNGLFTSSANIISSQNEGTSTDSQSYQQTLDLNWNRTVSPTLRYRLTLRARDIEDRTTTGSDLIQSYTRGVEPIFDATLASTGFSLNGGLTILEQWTGGNTEPKTLLSDRRWFTRLFLHPENLPTLSFQVDRFTSVNDLTPKSVNKSDTRYQVMTDYNYEGFNFSSLFSDRINDDLVTKQTRDQKDFLGSLGYTRSNWGGWMDVLGNYSIAYTPIHEEFSAAGLAEVQRPLSRGLKAAVDLTPADSSDVPLTDEPALIAGSALVPLEVNTSVGFEQTLTDSISLIRLNVSPQPPFTIPNNLDSFVTFRVFFTNDVTLKTWTELGAVSHRYEVLESRLNITFPATTARFFKVYVSRNDFGALIRATGVVALNLEPVGPGTKRSRTTLQHNVNGSFTIRPPGRPLMISALSYDVAFTDLTQQPDDRRNTTGTHTARITADPFRWLRSTATYQHGFANTNQAGTKNTTSDLYGLLFSSNPLPTLTTSLNLTRNDNRGEGKLETRSDAGSLNALAQLYRNLTLDSTYSLTKSRDYLLEQDTLSHSGLVNLNAILTPTLNATLGYTIRSTQTEQPETQTSDLVHTLSTSLTYTISRFLNINTRYDVLSGKDISSFTQDYRIDWTPTQKLAAFFEYRRTQQEQSGDRTGSDTFNINGRWNLSSYLNFDTNCVFVRDFAGNTVFAFSGRAQFRF